MQIRRKAFLAATLAVACGFVGTDARAVVINEVDYDNPSTDTAEFVELYNPNATSINIGGYVIGLINGSNDTFYTPVTTIPAGTILAPGAYYVVGAVAGANQTLGGSIQNGNPDAVGLYSSLGAIANGAASTTNSAALVDGIVYGGPDTAANYPGFTQSTIQDSGTLNTSFGRSPDGTGTFSLLASPTPGAANAAVVPEPASFGMLAAGTLMMAARRRRQQA